jgi:hypothetical protein
MAAMGPQDFVGLTSYFSYSAANNLQYPSVADVPFDYYSPIRSLVTADKPVVFTEIGWSSFFQNGLQEQLKFVNRLPSLLQDMKPANVIWASQHDLVNYFPGEIAPLNSVGLRNSDGSAKPAWDQILRLKNKGLYVARGTTQTTLPGAIP